MWKIMTLETYTNRETVTVTITGVDLVENEVDE